MSSPNPTESSVATGQSPSAVAGPTKSARLRSSLAQRFSLLHDKADDAEIERRIRDGAEMRGATPWILMFAILVASIGLNVNSTAVIIGAMLISPLMGPIMGVGLGVAVYDFDLVKRSLFNLTIAAVISLGVSTLYFTLSPLQEAQAELLARTSPTIWDVLIAVFGGMAGIIGMTRSEKSNVIPGVAIATALMPPVCTAGYGAATGQWHFVIGALYLFTINCVFISVATVIGIRLLQLRRHGFDNPGMERRVKLSLFLVAAITALPSGYLATNLVRDEIFRSRARNFVAHEFNRPATHVAETRIDPGGRKIEVSLIGEPLAPEALRTVQDNLLLYELAGAKVVVHQGGDYRVDMVALKTSLLGELLRDSQDELRKRDEELKELQRQLASRNELFAKASDMAIELKAQYPAVTRSLFSEGVEYGDAEPKRLVALKVSAERHLGDEDRGRILAWFRARVKSDTAIVSFDTPDAPPPADTTPDPKPGAASKPGKR